MVRTKKLPHYPIPVFLLAQMAINIEYKERGLGKITLIAALKYFYESSEHMPAYAVIVDCLNGDIESFYTQYGFKKLFTNKGSTRLYLPMKVVSSLFNDYKFKSVNEKSFIYPSYKPNKKKYRPLQQTLHAKFSFYER